MTLLTFAISPQLFCASLIILRRCSSAGVHGVFVLLFFGTFTGGIVSPNGSMGSPRPPGSPIPDAPIPDGPNPDGPNPDGGIDDSPDILDMTGCLRFLVGGDVGGGCGASKRWSGCGWLYEIWGIWEKRGGCGGRGPEVVGSC